MIRALTTELPLVGRDVELGRMVLALQGRDPVAFVLAGAAGVGKTRLANEVAKAAPGLGFGTAQVVASRAAASIPFGPFAPLLPVRDLAPGDLLGLLRQAGEAIAERAGAQRRLLLVVDDAHLLDDGSAALVYQLVQAATCSVVASVRAPGTAPDPITALWKDGLAERVNLNPLSEANVEELLIGALGGPVAGGTVRRLWEASGGNALCLRELLIGATGSGALVAQGGIWSLSHQPLTAPDRLVEVVASRLAGLAPATAGIIELLAVGEPLALSALEAVGNAAALEDAERLGFVAAHQDGRRAQARLAHPMYGEVLRQSLPRSRLRHISAQLATALEATGARRREDLLRLARWRLEAGEPSDPDLLSRAARQAAEMFDMELAARLAQRALDLGGGVGAGLVLGEANFRSGRHEEAERVLASLVSRCTNDTELAMVANARAYNLSGLMGDPAAAAAVLDQALAVISETNERLRLLGRLATNRLFEGEPEAALAAAGELLTSEDDTVVSRGAYTSSIALALLGRGDEAVAVAHRGLEVHRRAQDTKQLAEVQLVGAVLGHAASGRLAQAEADAARGYQACLAAGDKEGQATFCLLRGCALVQRGQLAAAARLFREGAALNRELHDTAGSRWCTGALALAEAMAGHAGPALAAIAALDELPAGWMTFFEPDVVERGRAWALVAAGELTRGCETLRVAAGRAAASKQTMAEAQLLHDVARLGQPAVVAPRLAALAEVVEGDWVSALADHARALARASAPELEAVTLAFEHMGALLLGAEASRAAAALYSAAGSARRATTASRRAGELLAACGDLGPSGRGGPEAIPGRLTRREREVAGLAAGGLASREIASRLFVSVRTVDNHLQNAYTKLGVTSREELGRALSADVPPG